MRPTPLATFGSMEAVLRHTRGVLLLHDDELVCEASTGAPIEGRIKVGVTTHEQFRGRGLATLTWAALLAKLARSAFAACEAEGLATWWDCATQNEPSVRLARRLGYGEGREYRYRWWQRHPG